MKKTRNTFQLRLEKEIERFYEGHKNYEIYAVRRAPANSPEPYFRAYVVMDKEIRYFVMSKFYQGKYNGPLVKTTLEEIIVNTF